MENSSNYHLLSKLSRLRKKPQQPLTDLTELYGRIANESIYFLKLEEIGDYRAALQGWKALNTDAMYRLTLIDHEHPDVSSYTREETSIKSGVRELYHKSLKHLERVKKLCDEDQSKQSSNGPRETIQHKVHENSSFVKRPHLQHTLNGSSRKMVTTLRDGGPRGLSSSLRSRNSSESKRVPAASSSQNRVNFTASKPLVKSNASSINDGESTNERFEGFDNETDLIDLTQTSDEEVLSTGKESAQASLEDDPFDFDFEDYYGDDDKTNGANDQDNEETRRLEIFGHIERQISNMSMNSPPMVPAPSLPSQDKPTTPRERPPVPTNQPPIPTNQPPTSTNQPPVHTIRASIDPAPKTASRPGQPFQKSHNSTGALVPTNSSKTGSKPRPAGKLNLPANTKATKSTPTLVNRQKIIQAPTQPSAGPTRPQTASTAAKRVLGLSTEPTHRAKPNQHARQPMSKRAPVSTAKRPPTAAKPPLTIAAAKKKAQESYIHANSRSSKDRSISPSSASSESLPSSRQRPNSETKETANPAPSVVAPPLPSSESGTENEQDGLKEMLEEEIINSLRGVDKTAAKQIFAEIVVHGDEVHWDDIAGLESAKSSLKEAVVYPFLRPDLFRGLREPVRGMLLFGPPGTGKTMLARAVATESHSTFFSISASSLTSKYLGESEKLVRALFAVAKKLSPSIIFVDEIDSIMGSRNSEGENESSRRIKNEFLIQWSSLSSAAAGNNKDDAGDEDDERVLVLAATNLPWSIDEAARRRFVRRQYIPLPEPETRSVHLKRLLSHQKHTLTEEDFITLLTLTEGFSGSDITSLAKDAAMGPLRELGDKLLLTPTESIRSMALKDFQSSLNYIKPSVSQEGLERYEDWAAKFGSSGI